MTTRELLRLARAVSIKLNTYGLMEKIEAGGYVPVEVRELSQATAELDAAIRRLDAREAGDSLL
jgi:hypothetical protein